MLLTVHDELVFEVPPEEVDATDPVGAGDHGGGLGPEGAAAGEHGHRGQLGGSALTGLKVPKMR